MHSPTSRFVVAATVLASGDGTSTITATVPARDMVLDGIYFHTPRPVLEGILQEMAVKETGYADAYVSILPSVSFEEAVTNG